MFTSHSSFFLLYTLSKQFQKLLYLDELAKKIRKSSKVSIQQPSQSAMFAIRLAKLLPSFGRFADAPRFAISPSHPRFPPVPQCRPAQRRTPRLAATPSSPAACSIRLALPCLLASRHRSPLCSAIGPSRCCAPTSPRRCDLPSLAPSAERCPDHHEPTTYLAAPWSSTSCRRPGSPVGPASHRWLRSGLALPCPGAPWPSSSAVPS